jgi:hypothetical protein
VIIGKLSSTSWQIGMFVVVKSSDEVTVFFDQSPQAPAIRVHPNQTRR